MSFHPSKKNSLRITIVGIVFLIGGILTAKIFFLTPEPENVLSEKQKQKAYDQMLGRSFSAGASEDQSGELIRDTPLLTYTYPANAKVLADIQHPVIDDETAASQSAKAATAAAPGPESFSYSLPIKHVVVSVQIHENSDVQKLSDMAGVKLRQQSPKIYQPFTVKVGSADTLGFLKKDETAEKIAFIFYKNNQITFAVTAYTMDQVDQIFNPLISSIVLK